MTERAEAAVPVVASRPGPARYMCGLTWDGERLWHSDQGAGTIYAIDPDDGTVVRTLDCPSVRADLTWHDGLLCQVGGRPKRIVLVDPVGGGVVGERQVLPASGRLCGVEAAPEGDGMWMGLRAPAVIQLRDAVTMAVRRELDVDGLPSGLTYVDGVVLYSEFEHGTIRAVDATTGAMLAVARVPGRPVGMTWDGGHVWYCDFAARRFNAVRLDDLLSARVVTRH